MGKIIFLSLLGSISILSLNSVSSTTADGHLEMNEPPIALNDTSTVAYGSVDTIDVLANDSDPEGGILNTRYVEFLGPRNGTAYVLNENQIIYTPNPAYIGKDSFQYFSCDVTSECSIAWIFMEVLEPNKPPEIDEDVLGHLSVEEDSTLNILVIANTNDPEDDVLAITLIEDVRFGETIIGQDTIIYIPEENYFGPDSLRYTVCDQEPLCDTITTYIEVLPINDAPIAEDDYENTDENDKILIFVTSNDEDVDNTSSELSIEILTQPQLGDITLEGLRIEYDPFKLVDGLDSLQYILCDLEPLCDTAWAYITIADVCDDCAFLAEGDSLTILTYAGYTDPTITFINTVVSTPPFFGPVSIIEDTIKYVPHPDYNGRDRLTYIVCDSEPQCDTVSMCIYIAPVNDPPEAFDDYFQTPEEIPDVFDPGNNDYDVDGDELIITLLTQPHLGYAESISNSLVDYTPYYNKNGLDSIQYMICDQEPLCDTAWMYIQVLPVDEIIHCIDEDSINYEVLPLTKEKDYVVDGFNLRTIEVFYNQLSNVHPPTSGATTSLLGDTAFLYTPPVNWHGLDTMLIDICYDWGVCITDTIFITVKPVDDPIVAVDDQVSLSENDSTIIEIIINDSNPDGGAVSIAILDPPNNGTSKLDSTALEYIPSEHYYGPDSMTYEICNSFGSCDTANVFITVTFINDPPVAINDIDTTEEDHPILLYPINNDSDPEDDTLLITILSQPENGTVTIDSDSSLLYTPNNNEYGQDSIQYMICDMGALCDTAWIMITVNAVADPVVAIDDIINLSENESTQVEITINDSNPDGGTITLTIIEPPVNGVATVDSNIINYTPTTDYYGIDSLVYEFCNSLGSCDTASVFFTVEFVNEKPSAPEPVTIQITDTIAINIDHPTNATDPNGDTLIIEVLHDRGGDVTIDSGGTITYIPPDDFMLADTIYYAVCDTHAIQLCDTSFIVIEMICPGFNHALKHDAICPDIAFSVTGTDIQALSVYEWSFTDQLGLITTEPTINELKINNPKRLALKSQRYGCLPQFDSINIVVRSAILPAQLDDEQIECENTSVSLRINESNSQLNYEWFYGPTNTAVGNGPELVIADLNNTTAGDYYVIANDGYCFSETSGNLNLEILTDLVPPEVNAGENQLVCGQDIILNASASSGMPSWSTNGNTFIADANNPSTRIFDPEIGENKFYWTQENQSCVEPSIDSVSIFYYPLPAPINDSFFVELNEDYTFDLKPNDNYYNLNVSISVLNIPEEVTDHGNGTVSVNIDGSKESPLDFEYEVCFDECPDNCTTTVVNIHYEQPSICNVPDVITPNGDGINDYLIIDCIDQHPQSSMIIFNRWGDEVYNNNDYDNSWNGMQDGKPLAAGTYFYLFKVNDSDKTVDKGFIHVDR